MVIIHLCTVNTSEINSLPEHYAKYADVFNATAVGQLPPTRPGLDYQINLKPDTTPPYGPLYNLSESELTVLQGYLETNLASGFI